MARLTMETLRRPAPSQATFADRLEGLPLLRVVIAKDGGSASTYEFFQPVIWGDALACRACWGDGTPRARIVRLGELCPCCHQGLMLKWEGGMRCRNCGNRGTSTRQLSRKFRAGDRCPSCAERPMLAWKGGIRCHGCGQSFR